jgi:excisionase family DNA binding protein
MTDAQHVVPLMLSTQQAARLAGCGVRAIREAIKRGLIPAVKLGPHFRIPRQPFLQFLEKGDRSLIEPDATASVA